MFYKSLFTMPSYAYTWQEKNYFKNLYSLCLNMLTHETKKLFPMDTCTTQIKIIKTYYFFMKTTVHAKNCIKKFDANRNRILKKILKYFWLTKHSYAYTWHRSIFFLRTHLQQKSISEKPTTLHIIHIQKNTLTATDSQLKMYWPLLSPSLLMCLSSSSLLLKLFSFPTSF